MAVLVRASVDLLALEPKKKCAGFLWRLLGGGISVMAARGKYVRTVQIPSPRLSDQFMLNIQIL